MHKLSENYPSKPLKVPTLVINKMDNEHLAVRFEQVGDRNRFRLVLQRFRSDFLLAQCQELKGQPWWIVKKSQQCEIEDFGRRNGMSTRFLEDL